MNPIYREAAATIESGWVLGLVTVLFLGCFLFWTWWAFASRHKARMEADSRLPLNDGGDS